MRPTELRDAARCRDPVDPFPRSAQTQLDILVVARIRSCPNTPMLTRKQQWRRVKCRRRTNCGKDSEVPESKCPAKGEEDTNADSEDEVSTTRTGAPSISTYSSFESVHSALGESEDCITSAQLAPPPDARGKGVTFEPRVQVFLVTHKSELDTR